jgi:hypothetical protein
MKIEQLNIDGEWEPVVDDDFEVPPYEKHLSPPEEPKR